MSGLLADPALSQEARPARRVKLGGGAPEILRAETRAAWSEPMGGQAVPGSAAGWQCAIQAHDSLLVSTLGLPAGVGVELLLPAPPGRQRLAEATPPRGERHVRGGEAEDVLPHAVVGRRAVIVVV